MKILICGDRNYDNQALVWTVLDGFYLNHNVGFGVAHRDPFFIIEGGAKGADRLAKNWVYDSPLHSSPDYNNHGASEARIVHLQFPANWNEYGRAAGPMRNFQMLNEGKPDIVLAFHDNIEKSKGTKHMVSVAKERGIPTYVIGRH